MGLVRLQSQGLSPELVRLAQDTDATLRYIAVQLLARCDSGQAVDPLIAALRDENGPVREEAARSLGRLKAEAARVELLDLMTRSHHPDGTAAAEALELITGTRYEIVE